jgi:hypothetical protein
MGRRRVWWCVLALTLVAGCDIGGGSVSASAAPNGYGSGAAEMVYVHLQPYVQQDAGTSLSQHWVGRLTVVFTDYTPIDHLIVMGVAQRSEVAGIEAQLRSDAMVARVTDGPPPTAPGPVPLQSIMSYQ